MVSCDDPTAEDPEILDGPDCSAIDDKSIELVTGIRFFDENGSSDIVLSYEKKGVKLPLRGRECSSEQIPAIKKRFETFESFARASRALDSLSVNEDKMSENLQKVRDNPSEALVAILR